MEIAPHQALWLAGAGVRFAPYQDSDVRAERLGLFVICATGSSASITNQPPNGALRLTSTPGGSAVEGGRSEP